MVPVSEKVLAYSELLPPQALGKNIHKHTEKKGLPVFANATVAIFAVNESRNAFEKKPERLDVDEIRIQLYRLMTGNWNSTILDIGDIEEGDTVEDTYFVCQRGGGRTIGGEYYTYYYRCDPRYYLSYLSGFR